MQVTFWRDPAVEIITLGDHVFHVPERNSLENRGDPFGIRCCISGLRQGGPEANLYMPAEEMAQIVEGYQVADGELKANIIWLVQFLDGQALERLHAPDKITSDIWYQRGHMENSVVSRYKETDFYRVQVEGDDVFWKLTKMSPRPGQPLPVKSEFFVASCRDGANPRTETGYLTSCKSEILHKNLLVSYGVTGFNLHLVDEIGEALVGKLEKWRARPVVDS